METIKGAFAKLRRATFSFVVPRLSVGPPASVEQLRSHGTDVHEIWHFNTFRKSAQKIQVSLTTEKNKGYFTQRPIYIFYHLTRFFIEWEMFQTKHVEKITHFMLNAFFFFANRAVYEKIVEKYCRTGSNRWLFRMRIACWIPKAVAHTQNM